MNRHIILFIVGLWICMGSYTQAFELDQVQIEFEESIRELERCDVATAEGLLLKIKQEMLILQEEIHHPVIKVKYNDYPMDIWPNLIRIIAEDKEICYDWISVDTELGEERSLLIFYR